jgi:hypothetical protein
MTAVGQLSAFVRKSGDTMTGDLTLPGDPDQPLEAATKQYVDNSGGGGGGAVSSVFGRTGAVVAVGTDYAAFYDALGAATGALASANAYTDSATAQTLSDANDYTDTQTTAAVTTAATYTDTQTAAAQAAAQAYTDSRRWLKTKSGLITSGNIGVLNSGSPTQIGPDLVLPAVAGEEIAVSIRCLVNPAGGELYWNAATIVGGVPVTYFGNGTGSWPFPLGGISSWFCNVDDFTSPRGEAWLTLGAPDIAVGNTVTVRIFAQADNNPRTVRADAGQPLQTHLVNMRA